MNNAWKKSKNNSLAIIHLFAKWEAIKAQLLLIAKMFTSSSYPPERYILCALVGVAVNKNPA